MALKKNNIMKVSFTIITVSLLLLSYAYYNLNYKYDISVDESSTENKLLQNQFDEILKKYDSISLINQKEESKEIEIAIQEALEDSKAFNTNLGENIINDKSFEAQIRNIKNEIADDSNRLIEVNNKILKNKQILNQLESISTAGSKLKHDKLSAINISARGVKFLSDLYSKASRKKIQQIRVCFTLEGNEFIRYGNKDIYIQIVNPKNQIISKSNSFISLDEVKLMYSAKTEALYDKKDVDVCTYVDLESEKTIKGKYIINIYNSFSKIGTTIFEYD